MKHVRVSTSSTAAQRIGELLKNLRVRQHLTGVQLALMADTSQSRISKLENGYAGTIDVDQIERLLDILDAPKNIRQQMSVLLFRVKGAPGSSFHYPFKGFPEELNDLQKSSTIFRNYIVSGLSAALQTSEYRRAYLERVGVSESDIQMELAKTIERQDALFDLSKTFYFVMPETVLYTMPGDVSVQLAQLDRLERMVNFKNVHIGFIPTQAGSTYFETSTFTFYDDHHLFTFIGDRVIQLNDTEVQLKFMNAFEELVQLAHFGSDAITLIRKASNHFSGLSVSQRTL